MKNILKIVAIATAATIGLSASAKSLEAIKREDAIGKDGKTTTDTLMKDVKTPDFMKGLVDTPKSRVESIVGTDMKNATAREALIKGLEAKDPNAEGVWSLVAGLSDQTKAKVLKELNSGIAMNIVAKNNGVASYKASLPRAGIQWCSTSDKLHKFEGGFPGSLKSEFEAANDASKAVIPGGAWADGECGIVHATDEGGSSEYDLSARINLARLIISEKVCNFTTACATKMFAEMKHISEAAALPIIRKFNKGTPDQKGCYIHRLADVDGNLAAAAN